MGADGTISTWELLPLCLEVTGAVAEPLRFKALRGTAALMDKHVACH